MQCGGCKLLLKLIQQQLTLVILYSFSQARFYYACLVLSTSPPPDLVRKVPLGHSKSFKVGFGNRKRVVLLLLMVAVVVVVVSSGGREFYGSSNRE